MKLLYLDTETTGKDPDKSGLIQISGIIEIDGNVAETFDIKCRPFPGKEITDEALEVNGQTREGLADLPDPSIAYGQLKKRLDAHIDRFNRMDKFYLVGQNVKFDYDFLTAFFKDNGDRYLYSYINYHLIDIISITALFKIAGKVKVENLKLSTIAEFFKLEFKAHDALEDIRITREIFYKYLDMVKK